MERNYLTVPRAYETTNSSSYRVESYRGDFKGSYEHQLPSMSYDEKNGAC